MDNIYEQLLENTIAMARENPSIITFLEEMSAYGRDCEEVPTGFDRCTGCPLASCYIYADEEKKDLVKIGCWSLISLLNANAQMDGMSTLRSFSSIASRLLIDINIMEMLSE